MFCDFTFMLMICRSYIGTRYNSSLPPPPPSSCIHYVKTWLESISEWTQIQQKLYSLAQNISYLTSLLYNLILRVILLSLNLKKKKYAETCDFRSKALSFDSHVNSVVKTAFSTFEILHAFVTVSQWMMVKCLSMLSLHHHA